MDFDFTDDNGNGIEVEADKQYGVLISATQIDQYTGTWISPELARDIAKALNACADYMEDK